jgi:hypothetical protein
MWPRDGWDESGMDCSSAPPLSRSTQCLKGWELSQDGHLSCLNTLSMSMLAGLACLRPNVEVPLGADDWFWTINEVLTYFQTVKMYRIGLLHNYQLWLTQLFSGHRLVLIMKGSATFYWQWFVALVNSNDELTAGGTGRRYWRPLLKQAAIDLLPILNWKLLNFTLRVAYCRV